jgi:hypothetical protein
MKTTERIDKYLGEATDGTKKVEISQKDMNKLNKEIEKIAISFAKKKALGSKEYLDAVDKATRKILKYEDWYK